MLWGKYSDPFLTASPAYYFREAMEEGYIPHKDVFVSPSFYKQLLEFLCGSTHLPQEFQQLFVTLSHTHTLLLVLLLILYKGCHRDVSNVVNGEKSKQEFSL